MSQRKKSSARTASIIAQHRSQIQKIELPAPPTDTLHLKVMSLRLSDQEPKHYAIKVTFFDQLLLHAIIKSIGMKDEEPVHAIANGSMPYDPSDYEKMGLFADSPLVVQVQPLRNIDTSKTSSNLEIGNYITISHTSSISCCNVDILPIFIGLNDKMCIRKRLEPMVPPAPINAKSWDTLPLITLEMKVERDPVNEAHHKVLENANWMKVTLVGCYNMFIPFEKEYLYTAATKTPLHCEARTGVVTFSQGYKEPKRFDFMNFYPHWESLRSSGELFTQCDSKFQCKLEDLDNEDNIDIPYYLNPILPYHTAIWGSFHRTLMLLNDHEQWLWNHLRKYKWPLEVHIFGETGGYSFMAFLNLFQLLFPGEHTVRLAVPLKWVNAMSMMKECACELLLTPNENPPAVIPDGLAPIPTPPPKTSKSSKGATESIVTTVSTLTGNMYRPTGSDTNEAFVIVEVQFGRPLKAVFKPPNILKEEITAMLTEMELEVPKNRNCTGRGQLEREWQKTVRAAANALRKVPYYGTTDFCTFNRQLSATRTRVELTTSFWQNASIYINNNFIVHQYLDSDETFEELVMMAHACLMRSASAILIKPTPWHELDPVVRAARHARQMQDIEHAAELYLQLVVDKPEYPHYWRELSTCLKDLLRDWAIVCLNKAVVLNPRSPLTLLSKGAMLFEEDPTAAEPFFFALLEFSPNWYTAWTIASVYFYKRELFHLADTIMQYALTIRGELHPEDINYRRAWERELGDWWDSTPLLPGMSLYYDAADLLLRLRAIPLAEACLARLLSVTAETAAYYHLVGLCCRLRGQYDEAICHLTVGLGKFGEVSYLRSLEAECQHRLGEIKNSTESFAKVGTCVNSFSILMSLSCGDNKKTRSILMELIRRQASAYAWNALADDWLKTHMTNPQEEIEEGVKNTEQLNAKSCAIACAVQALKIDRRAGRAWAILGKLVKPSARRLHCLQMANLCGWKVTDEDVDLLQTPCHFVGTALRECRCYVRDKTKV